MLASFIPAVLGVLVLMGMATEVPMKTKRASALPSFEGLDTRFKLFLFVVLLFTLGNSSDSFIILLGQNCGLDVLQIMLMLMTFNFIYAALSGPLGAWSDKIGRRRLIIGGWIAYGLVYLGLALSNAGWHVWILYALYGIYYAATDGVGRALVAGFCSRGTPWRRLRTIQCRNRDHRATGFRDCRRVVARHWLVDRIWRERSVLFWRGIGVIGWGLILETRAVNVISDWQTERAMKIVLNVIGVLLILPGIIFFLQGINVLPGSFMTGQTQWAINGGILIVVGAGLLWWANRRR